MVRIKGFDPKGIAKARERGSLNQPNDAVIMSFLPNSSQIYLRLRNRTELKIPVRSITSLADVTKPELKKLRLSRVGDAIELPEHDLNISVAGLVRRAVTGDDPYAKAGSTRSKAKSAAARANGKKGGRPKHHTSIAI